MTRNQHDIVNDHFGVLDPSQIPSGVGGIVFEVRGATTTNGTLSTDYENGDLMDGLTLATGDRILLKNQGDGGHPEQNGIYIVNASGAPTRAPDYDSDDVIYASVVYVSRGTSNGGSLWGNSNISAAAIPTDGITYVVLTPFKDAGSGNVRFGRGINELLDENESAYLFMDGSGSVDLNAGSESEMRIEANDGTAGGTTAAPKHVLVGGHGVVFPLLSADPSGPHSTEGQVYMNTTTHKLRCYNGSTWNDLF